MDSLQEAEEIKAELNAMRECGLIGKSAHRKAIAYVESNVNEVAGYAVGSKVSEVADLVIQLSSVS